MKNIVFIIACFFSIKCNAQDIKNIFAYKNVILRGNIPVMGGGKNSDPNIKPQVTEVSLPTFDYYIFVETTNGKSPIINTLIVDNKSYQFTIEKITKVPLNYEYWDGSVGDSGHKQVVMITKNQKNIFKIVLGEIINTTKNKNAISINYKVAKINKVKNLLLIKEMPSSVVY
jgi:hypothetical protein